MEKMVELSDDLELRCPICDGGDLTVRHVHVRFPAMGVEIDFGPTPLAIGLIDGNDAERGGLILTINCPRCSPEKDAIYLRVTDLYEACTTPIPGDGNVVQALWDTDWPDYAAEKAILEAFAAAGPRGLTAAEVEAQLQAKREPKH